MNKSDIQILVSLLTFAAGGGTTALGMIKWFRSEVRKRYKAEEEFKQLKQNQAQMMEALKKLSSEVSQLSAESSMQVALSQQLANRNGESISSILGYKKRRQASNPNEQRNRPEQG